MSCSFSSHIGYTSKKNGQATRTIAKTRRQGKRLVGKKKRRTAKREIKREMESV